MASDSNATNTLQAIRYNRGSLQLLDQVALHFPLHFNFIPFFFWLLLLIVVFVQRKLPLESVYLEIRDSNDGW
jgi:Ni/Fe-hydrogenase subunit HybB-like protein